MGCFFKESSLAGTVLYKEIQRGQNVLSLTGLSHWGDWLPWSYSSLTPLRVGSQAQEVMSSYVIFFFTWKR